MDTTCEIATLTLSCGWQLLGWTNIDQTPETPDHRLRCGHVTWWHGQDLGAGLGALEHEDKASAYRYAPVLVVTSILEADSDEPSRFEHPCESRSGLAWPGALSAATTREACL